MHVFVYSEVGKNSKKTTLVIAGLTRNPLNKAHYSWDCGSEAAMTGAFPASPG
jgi:hypothetical protein